MTVEQLVRARLDGEGRQIVGVRIDHGYHPDAIVARADVPLRLLFQRNDDDVCSERVVFSAPRVDRRLAATGTTVVDLPAQPPGEIRFTCGMGRYRGRIQLVAQDAQRDGVRAVDLAHRVRHPVAAALVPWLASVLLIAFLMLSAMDLATALVVSGLGLTTWIVAAAWVGRERTDHS